MLSGSMMPQFSSTILTCRLKNGTSVGHLMRSTGSLPMLATISVASSGLTCSYSTSSGSTATSGPCEHRPRQPTPFTWHSCSRPCSATAASSASLTWLLCCDRQPAAVQTRMHCLCSACLACSSAAIWSNPSRVIMYCHLFYALLEALDRHVADDLTVEGGGGRQTARAQAANRQQRKFAVLGRLAGLNAVGLLDVREDLVCSLDVASRAGADGAAVFALRLELEVMVERCDTVHLGWRYRQHIGNVQQRRLVQVAEGALDGVQSLNQGVRAVAVPPHCRLDDSPAFIVCRWRRVVRNRHLNLYANRKHKLGPVLPALL